MASISKRGRYWRAQIVRRGYPPQYRTFDTRAEAEAWSRAMESEMDRGIFVSRVESEKTTLADALGRYEREISVGKAHPEQDYQRIRHWLRQDLAHYFLANLRGADFAKYRDDRLAIGRAANTVRLELALVSHLFEIARKERGMEGLMNPLKNIRKPSTAVQIELVGFAHLPKDMRSLTQLARLCRWIEATHGVARVWPAGVPRPAKNGHDPGGHNRDAPTWDGQSGHYGHCHVPENSHWDPGYSEQEVVFLMDATFDKEGRLVTPLLAAAPRKTPPSRARRSEAKVREPRSTMPDHSLVPTGLSAYIHNLPLPKVQPFPRPLGIAGRRRSVSTVGTAPDAAVDVGSLLCFVDGVPVQDREDVLYSTQLAQRGASGAFDRFTETQSWYGKYTEILENLGWTAEQLAFSQFDQSEGEFRMDKAALAIITVIATQNQLAVLQASVAALSKLAEDDGTISLFDFHASAQDSGNFQLGAVQRTANGALTMALGAFYFRSLDERRRFLFFKWGAREAHFWTAAQRLTLNSTFYARRRAEVQARLEADAPQYIAGLKLN